ncbi:hypothetical protein RH831_08885 [Halodesulfurarchaeum sp. HSR-GB]|uniref:Uncharacterized protein n=1 Tax=Halodesulfurarchaeum formicicum TaxID=1873524 RepID=A0A1J1ACD1_9EURY|nr:MULTISPECIES: hypothetical protein [Halodesulfurarchaeum]APE95424.1 hypothetical protein HSR6_0971 [Halodesulfurarchaeum formicicum]MDR5657294.1 hypothetical protein [Halodesulfurarchaeum sp. HSR-GB]
MAAEDWIERAQGLNPAEATSQGISALILAIFGIAITISEAFSDGLARVLGVMADFRDFVAAFFQSPITILNETADFTAFSLTQGDWAFFGPGTWAVGVASIVFGFYVWTVLDPDIPIIDNLLPWR